MHYSLWGATTFLFFLHLATDWADLFYAFHIEHILSNLNWLAYSGGLVLLSVEAFQSGDFQGYLEMTIYGLFFVCGIFVVELMSGVKAIQILNPEYPYDDVLLLPSLWYLLGWTTHTNRLY